MTHRHAYEFALLLGLVLIGVVLAFVPVPPENREYVAGIFGALVGLARGIGGSAGKA
jgi:hypothetical protein